MKVTINDVAREAGVSKSTVSRVISNNERISKETKDKVNEVIKRLGYKPNLIARNLAKSKTRTLGVVLPTEATDYFSNPIYTQIMQGISTFAQENNYYIMYAFCKEKSEEENIRDFSSTGVVDGIIMLKSEENDKTIKYLKKIKFPFVVIGRPSEENSVLWVDNDNVKSTYELTNELFEKNFKKIAFISAKENWIVSKDRLKGYKEALEKHFIKYDANLIYQGDSFTEGVGYEGMKCILEKENPQVIITTDDLLALGVNRYLKEVNINNKIIIGYNNTVLAAYQQPALSSVEIYGEKLGYEASKILINSIEGNDNTDNYEIIETRLVKRGLYL